MRIFNLSKKTGNLSSNDFFGVDNGSTVNKIDYNALAKAIIEQYTGSSLAGSAQSVKAALDALNSNSLFWQFKGLTFAQLDTQLESSHLNTPFIGQVSDSSTDRPSSGVNTYIAIGWMNSTKLYGWMFAVGFGDALYIRTRRNSTNWSAWKSVALS